MPRIKVGEKTQSSFLGDKVALRANNLPDDPVVLDCFEGAGQIWDLVEERIGRPIPRIGVDVKRWTGDTYLPGDNVVYLKSLDLSRFSVIDLDAYGMPYCQLRAIMDRGWHGRVFVTFIQLGGLFVRMPFGFLKELGFSREMIERCPSLFCHNSWEHVLDWLARCGVRTVKHRTYRNLKHYMAFDL